LMMGQKGDDKEEFKKKLQEKAERDQKKQLEFEEARRKKLEQEKKELVELERQRKEANKRVIADNDDILLTTHTHLGNLGAPCPILVPTEKINSIQAKARNTKVG